MPGRFDTSQLKAAVPHSHSLLPSAAAADTSRPGSPLNHSITLMAMVAILGTSHSNAAVSASNNLMGSDAKPFTRLTTSQNPFSMAHGIAVPTNQLASDTSA